MSLPALSRALAAHRRLVSSVLAGLAVLLALSAVRPAPPPSVEVLAAARDLTPGAALALDDLRAVALPPAAVPAGALRPGAAVLGRVVAAPVRRGEPLTDVRLLGPSLLAAVAGSRDVVAAPVRFADAGTVALLRPGDRIDVLAAPPESALPPVVAATDPGAATRSTPAVPGTPRGPGTPGGPGSIPGGQGSTAARARPTAPAAPPAAAGPAARVVAADLAVLAVTADERSGLGDGALVVVACSLDVARALAAAGVAERLSPVLRPPAPPGATPSPEPSRGPP